MTPQPLRPFSIHMFLLDGTPDGIKIIEKSNWIGKAVAFPRGRFADLRRRKEFGNTGVYVLVGGGGTETLPAIYVGEGDPVTDRLTSHYEQKDFWSNVDREPYTGIVLLNNQRRGLRRRSGLSAAQESRTGALVRAAVSRVRSLDRRMITPCQPTSTDA